MTIIIPVWIESVSPTNLFCSCQLEKQTNKIAECLWLGSNPLHQLLELADTYLLCEQKKLSFFTIQLQTLQAIGYWLPLHCRGSNQAGNVNRPKELILQGWKSTYLISANPISCPKPGQDTALNQGQYPSNSFLFFTLILHSQHMQFAFRQMVIR